MKKLTVFAMFLFLAIAGVSYTTGCSTSGNTENTAGDAGTTKDTAETKDDNGGTDKPTSRPAP